MKFPHTPYFSFSPSVSEKDRKESGTANLEDFLDVPIVITTKLDGSNFQMSREKVAARNGNIAHGISFDYAKQLHAAIRDRIPSNIIIFGEWLYAKHSIHYISELSLPSYFQVFAVFNVSTQTWKSWDAVERYADLIEFPTVPVIATYPPCSNLAITEETIALTGEDCIANGHEGIVVRNADAFQDFAHNVAKYVRANHVQTDEHWSKQPIIRNELSETL